MTVCEFHKRLMYLISELENTELNTPCTAIVDTLQYEADRIKRSGCNFTHQLKDSGAY